MIYFVISLCLRNKTKLEISKRVTNEIRFLKYLWPSRMFNKNYTDHITFDNSNDVTIIDLRNEDNDIYMI